MCLVVALLSAKSKYQNIGAQHHFAFHGSKIAIDKSFMPLPDVHSHLLTPWYFPLESVPGFKKAEHDLSRTDVLPVM